MAAALAEVVAADDPAAWERVGFTVGDGAAIALGGVTVRLEAPGGARGLVALALAGVEAPPRDVDGIPLRAPARAPSHDAAAHPNGALAVDHVVVTTPALDRTLGALRAVGLAPRRTRDVPGERSLRQAFIVAGPCVLEVVGPPGRTGAGPAALWGLTVVVADVDALARDLGPRAGSPRDAVQPGRRIVTVRRDAGPAVALAFMTPRARREVLRVERT